MSHSTVFLRFLMFAVAFIFVVPPSVFAEPRHRQRTDMEQLASELRQVVAPDSVDVSHSGTRRQPVAEPSGRPPEPLVARRSSISIEDVLDEMNRYRREHGLSPLRLDERLTLAAHDRVNDMATRRYFGHVGPDGTAPWVWVAERGYRYSSVGENLAAGYRSAQHVVDGWMRSRGHRANILGQFSDVGVAVANVRTGVAGPTFVALYATSR